MFELLDFALEREKAAFRDEFSPVTQAMIQTLLPAIEGTGLQPVRAAEFGSGRDRLPLLENGELLLGGDTAAATAFGGWILGHLHIVKRAFQAVQISTGADHGQWNELPGGGRRYRLDVTGWLGWRARYLKDLDVNETTLRFWQEIYDDADKLVETHEKLPVDKGHQKA